MVLIRRHYCFFRTEKDDAEIQRVQSIHVVSELRWELIHMELPQARRLERFRCKQFGSNPNWGKTITHVS